MNIQQHIFQTFALLVILSHSPALAQEVIDSSLVFENPLVEGGNCYVSNADPSFVHVRGATFRRRKNRFIDSLALARKMTKRKKKARKAGLGGKAKRLNKKAKRYSKQHDQCRENQCDLYDYYQGTEIGQRIPACGSSSTPTPTPAPVPDSTPSPNPTISPTTTPSSSPEPTPTPFTDDASIVGEYRFSLSGSIPTIYSQSLLLEDDGSFRLVISKVFTVYPAFNYIPCGTRVMLYRIFGSYTYLNNILSLSSEKREKYFSEVTGCFPNNFPLDVGEEPLFENYSVVAGASSNGLTVVADEYNFEGSTYFRADYCYFMPFLSWCEEVESFDTLFLERE